MVRTCIVKPCQTKLGHQHSLATTPAWGPGRLLTVLDILLQGQSETPIVLGTKEIVLNGCIVISLTRPNGKEPSVPFSPLALTECVKALHASQKYLLAAEFCSLLIKLGKFADRNTQAPGCRHRGGLQPHHRQWTGGTYARGSQGSCDTASDRAVHSCWHCIPHRETASGVDRGSHSAAAGGRIGTLHGPLHLGCVMLHACSILQQFKLLLPWLLDSLLRTQIIDIRLAGR